jgi:hypothetical protein
VGRTGFEPVTSSVSGNVLRRSCFRISVLSCCEWSTRVRWRPSLSAAIVTQLVTRSPLLLLVLVFDLSHRCGRVNEVRPSDGLAWIQGVCETQSRVTVLAQVFRVYLGRLILGAFFWGHRTSLATVRQRYMRFRTCRRPSMRITGERDDWATAAARKRRLRSCVPAVVRPCCCTLCCTDLTLKYQGRSVGLLPATLALLALALNT